MRADGETRRPMLHRRRWQARRPGTALLLVVPALLLSPGCSPDRTGGGPSEGGGEGALVVSDDPELEAMAARLLPELARRSGLELHEPVRVSRRSREELIGYLSAKLDQDLPDERARMIVDSYALLGLLPSDFDLRSILLSVYTEQVAGFYDPDSTALFVLEDQPAESLETVLIHELVHAVQDQAANLDSLTAPARGNDRQLAAQAAIEGHATVVMLEYLAEQAAGEPVDLSSIPNFTSQVRPALESLNAQYPALAGAPRVIQETLLFPYLEGAGYVQKLWQEGSERSAPFGPLLPRSTEEVLRVGETGSDGRDAPTTVFIEALGESEPAYSNGLGEMEVRILVEEMTGRPPARRPLGWDGDRFALFRNEDGETSLVWVSVWDTLLARDAFIGAVRPGLEGMSRPAVVSGIDLDGRPGLLIEIGDPPEIRAWLDGVEEP